MPSGSSLRPAKASNKISFSHGKRTLAAGKNWGLETMGQNPSYRQSVRRLAAALCAGTRAFTQRNGTAAAPPLGISPVEMEDYFLTLTEQALENVPDDVLSPFWPAACAASSNARLRHGRILAGDRDRREQGARLTCVAYG
jgi:hypothetical protein